jgi:hypothetical protein
MPKSWRLNGEGRREEEADRRHLRIRGVLREVLGTRDIGSETDWIRGGAGIRDRNWRAKPGRIGGLDLYRLRVSSGFS